MFKNYNYVIVQNGLTKVVKHYDSKKIRTTVTIVRTFYNKFEVFGILNTNISIYNLQKKI